jgi:hypothetical protein
MFLSSDFVCPFWRVWRQHFSVKFCDNVRDGVPSCVVDGFYPDLDPFSFEDIDAYNRLMDSIEVCSHFVRTEVWYSPEVVKRGCLFGGSACVHSDVNGFMSCVGCSRFVSVVEVHK